ncbi:MAG TPA: ABC transporter ATP-binding protein [Bacillota bacterium]|jgi:oligopeptide transport system ATP-binding protein
MGAIDLSAGPIPHREPILEIRNLVVTFRTFGGNVRAVDIGRLDIRRGEIFGLVGETGSGKSVTALSILRLLPEKKVQIESGEIIFKGQDLLRRTEAEMREIRGHQITMIFQDPMSSLNPVFAVGEPLTRVIAQHAKVPWRAARQRALDMLNLVRLPDPEKILGNYPHELSGGMRQRVMIAMALSSNPDLLLADEPTTALDVTIQAQILRLIGELRAQINASIVFITHNLGVVAKVSDRVAVMYAGNVVELGPTLQIFRRPAHPYTDLLLKAIPRLGERRDTLPVIEGTVPAITRPEPGCHFQPRCPQAADSCRTERPALTAVGPDHFAACWKGVVR